MGWEDRKGRLRIGAAILIELAALVAAHVPSASPEALHSPAIYTKTGINVSGAPPP